ncbi:carboxylesterase/lipase family protein [Mycolicibacterium sp. CH28]|uniref:carboxylesterase/lipase family protein n=1 Tax=Mycolicibacterium sp. CH28 TaxID=2512237 RepID=UPI0010813CE9|nr:carboxylesterase family protein [Mycolicibacterium sp. CH28]TGD88411.1 carboxylesterase/lipase family protein [Mycolicibacterium sp. CH28]
MSNTVRVTQGYLRGTEDNGILAFKGIPYAAAPIGVHRFKEPTAAPAWEGIRDATEYGPTAPSLPYSPPLDQLIDEPVIEGPDYLNLNVWTPATDAGRRPVLVWIHGGAFANGSGAVSAYDGSRFARDGVVCVTVNYRLGAEGFLQIDGAPANRGLLDQIAALRWVRDNIAAFGGDPEAVTIAGESAGAMSVTTLLTTPQAAGLFRRAIAESGAGHHVQTPTTAAKVTAAVAEELGVEATLAGFTAASPADLLAAQGEVGRKISEAPDPTVWGELATSPMPFQPVIDGAVVAARPIDSLVAGVGCDVDVLIGTNAREAALFLVPNGAIDAVNNDTLAKILALMGADADVVLPVYREAQPSASAGELLVTAVTDWFYRVPAVRVAESRMMHGANTHVYEFGWPSPFFDGRLGACHTVEIAFAFDQLASPASAMIAGVNPPQELADEVHGAWVSFVRGGDPGWPPYGEDRIVRRLNAHSDTVTDPAADQRRIWDGIR